MNVVEYVFRNRHYSHAHDILPSPSRFEVSQYLFLSATGLGTLRGILRFWRLMSLYRPHLTSPLLHLFPLSGLSFHPSYPLAAPQTADLTNATDATAGNPLVNTE